MSQSAKRPIHAAVLELPEGAKEKLEGLISQWETQLSEELSKAIKARRAEMISRLNVRLGIARAMLESGRCHVHDLQCVKAAADHVVANAISYLRMLIKPYASAPSPA